VSEVNLKEVLHKALEEIASEEFRARVEREKQRLRLRKSLWVMLFPWRIRVERRDAPKEADWVCASCYQGKSKWQSKFGNIGGITVEQRMGGK
jgi:hypothetical protein